MISISGYQILEQLYNGLRTLVYRAIREADRKPVVIKILKNSLPDFSELVQFRNQYTIASRFNYPGIIQTYSLENYQNSYALVMEDIQGISLRKYMLGENIASLQDILSIAVQVSNILGHIHHNRVIHKDIKPDNILINPQTKEIKLIDFSIASLLPKETQEIKNPNVLEGTLAYLSPEQTGRMNRGVDFRADFYAFGVTLFELLTGELPFKSDDAVELVHCHIAKQPPNINKPHPNPLLGKERAQEIPEVIGNIVIKLMAKNAEDRYQSALGLKHDLELCLKQIKETGKIENFEIPQRDICDQFIIPEKLYGRESEVEQLLAAFDRVGGVTRSQAQPGNVSLKALPSDLLEAEPVEMHYKAEPCNEGKAELMLVAGFSGIGKTAIVNEVHKPIVKQRGYFIKGKFDQFNRNIPFSAFVQAFRDLMGQLLSENDAQLSSWKHQILQALGENARIIIDVIPELEQIIGKQLPAPELSGTAAQNRFNLLFQKFIQVFTTKEHPLVVFLDDLQWADSASLNLMQLLLSESESRYLLLIGAYRDNEVFPAHPLILTLEEIAKASAIVNTITLTPLKQESLNQLVADTLNCASLIAQPLTELIYQKTQGNPFFSTQFLKVLYEDSLIEFDFNTGSWVCDITKVKALALTDDVVEFMALQLQKLPESTQNVLKLAACIGNQFDLKTLAVVSQNSEAQTALFLWEALQSGLILPQSEVYKFYLESETNTNLLPEQIINYKFLHDRVQQAAYSLIPDNQKQKTHYHIGQLLLQQTSPEAIEECIFELVNQLNYGTDLITEEKQRTELAKLNLIACRKARSTIAYQAAREYVSIGLSLLGENAWKNQYEMSLAFHDLGAELASLCGNFEEMEHFVETVIINARCLIEQVNVYRIRIQSNVSRNKLIEAITIGLQLLQKFGVTFPKTPTPEEIQHSMAEVCQLIGDSEIEDLVNLPIKTDVEKIAIIQITNSIMTPAYICGSPLTPLLISKSVKLSIQYGNTEDSALAYAAYAIMACNMLKNVDMGVKFGELALRVVSKLDAKAFKPEILDVIGFFILHRKSHIKKTLPIVQEGYAVGLEVGNLQFAGYNTNVFCFNSFWCAQPLATLEQKTRAYCNWLVQLNQLTAANWCRIYWQPILNLLGAAEHPSILSGEALQEAEFLPQLIEAHDSGGLFKFNLCKLMLCFLFGEFESAQKHAVEARRYLVASAGGVCEPAFYFYDSLVILAALTQSEETSELLERVEQNQTQLQQYWAKYAPMNYQHKVDLVAAEKYRILGKKAEAIELYDKAISGAKVNEYTQEEALSNELAAKFYLDWDKEKVASGYMQEAYYCYARWGAKAKTDDLEKRYPQLLAAILQTQQNNLGLNEISSSFNKSSILNQTIQTTRNSTSIDEAFDFASILKASQALSSEIQLEQLISKLIQVVIENAGALKAALILFEQDKLMLKALANTSDIKLLNLPYENSLDIPNTVINYVKRNQKTIVLDDATQNSDFIADSYLIQQQPKSLLCMPILNQGKIIGLLYLENNLTTGAFTQNRVEIINLLCSQAAISLENAQLYSQLKNYSHTLEEKVEQRTQEVRQTLKELQQTQAQLIQNEKMSSLGQLVAGIAHEINNPISFIYGNLTPASEYTLDLIELIDLYQKLYPQPLPEIESKIEDIDLDYLTEDLPKLLDSMQTGAQRIREIVLSLRIFSRLDEAEIKPVDIHSGIDSTLLILQNKLAKNAKYPEIEVIKQYNQLPKVNCYASQLNQVFLNIIGNAIDALRDKYKDKPTITISTSFQDDKNILISIKDNGVGMSKSVLNKIFDPFFSTKPVGSGTGLGLSTSYSIVVEKHQGKLSCNSILGEGTEFLIELPLL